MGGWSVMWSHCNLTHWDWIGWFWVKYTNFYKSNQITSRLSAGYFLKIHSVQPHLYSKQCGRLCTEKLFKQWLLQCCRVNVSSGDHTCSLTAALVSTESQGYKEVGYRAWNIITAYVLIHWWVNNYESVHLKHNKIVTYYPTGIFDSNFMNEEIKLSVIQLARALQEGRSQSLIRWSLQSPLPPWLTHSWCEPISGFTNLELLATAASSSRFWIYAVHQQQGLIHAGSVTLCRFIGCCSEVHVYTESLNFK